MINFIDLDKQYLAVKKVFLKKLDLLMSKGEFILGQEVKSFENEFSGFSMTKYAIGVNSGTDALFLSLKCLGIGPGDEVIVPVFTFIATSFAVSFSGARPVFVDIEEDSYNIDSRKLEKAITRKTKAIIPVHLFGLCANMPEILHIAKKYHLAVIEDAAQAHGAQIGGEKAGSMGDFGCFSFYPTKNLSAFGDAGIIITNSFTYYKKLLQLRDCGRDTKRYLHKIIGYNSRLDNAQALFLRLKLRYIKEWNEKRIDIAKLYTKILKNAENINCPIIPSGYKHVFHAYSIRTKKRKKLTRVLNQHKIPYAIYYQLPLHLQESYRFLGYKKGQFPIAERVSEEILGLPIHPHLTNQEIIKIAKLIDDNEK